MTMWQPLIDFGLFVVVVFVFLRSRDMRFRDICWHFIGQHLKRTNQDIKIFFPVSLEFKHKIQQPRVSPFFLNHIFFFPFRKDFCYWWVNLCPETTLNKHHILSPSLLVNSCVTVNSSLYFLGFYFSIWNKGDLVRCYLPHFLFPSSTLFQHICNNTCDLATCVIFKAVFPWN